MASIGDLVANLSVNSRPFSRGLNSARNSLASFAASAAGMLGIGSALGSIGWGVQLAAQAEQAEVSFEVLLGSAAKAKTIIADLRDYAAVSSFDVAGANTAAQMLANYGIQAQDILPTMKMLGDVAQGDVEKFKNLARAFGQVTGAGKLRAQEKNQFIDAGFNPLQEMERTTGKSQAQLAKDMEEGKISTLDVANAFKTATSEGGRFFGMTDRQSKTTTGRFNTMKESLGNSFRELGTSILTSMDVSGWMQRITDFADEVPFVFRNLGSLIQIAVIDWGVYLLELIPGAANVMQTVASIFIAGWDASISGFTSFVQNLKAGLAEIGNLATATWAMIKAGIAAIGSGRNPITAAKEAFTATLASQKNVEGGKGFVQSFNEKFAETFKASQEGFNIPGNDMVSGMNARKQALLDDIGNSEAARAAKRADLGGKAGDSFKVPVEEVAAKAARDTASSAAALKGSEAAAKIMTSGLGGDNVAKQQLTVAQKMEKHLATIAKEPTAGAGSPEFNLAVVNF